MEPLPPSRPEPGSEAPAASPEAPPVPAVPGQEAPVYTAAPRGPLLPAAARVILYLIAWILAIGGIVVAIVLSYIVAGMIANQGQLPSLDVLGRGDALPPLPLLGAIHVGELMGTLGVTVLFTAFLDRRPFRSLGFELVRGWPLHWGFGVLVEGLHMGSLFLLGVAAGWYHVVSVAPLSHAVTILVVAVALALPAAAVEEITTRGYVLQALEQRYGSMAALLVSSGLFAVLHLLNPGGRDPLALLGLLLAGIYLGAAYLATRQLWLPIAMHTAWNVYEGPVLGLPVSGMPMPDSILRVESQGPALWTGGGFGPEAGLPIILTTAFWTAAVWWAARRLPGARQTSPPGAGR